MSVIRFAALMVAVCAMFSAGASAQNAPLDRGWTLTPEASQLNFQSVKKQTVVESSSFATLAGTISDTGAVEVRVLLDSVDTKVDLRNVRMRFLFFETFKYPEAVITAQIDPADLADLAQVRRKQFQMAYEIDLHGVTKALEAPVTATLLTDDMVSITSSRPISLGVADFDLTEGLSKLEEAANVDIIPSATVSFDFVFNRNADVAAQPAVAEAPVPAPTNVALETQGDFDAAACKGRFEILSRTGNIYFTSGSARLEDKSAPLLTALADIIARCPGMRVEVGGHTDAQGSEAFNQQLSQKRAASVTAFLLDTGLDSQALTSKGYGESQPIATNATREGRWKNRRISFAVLGE